MAKKLAKPSLQGSVYKNAEGSPGFLFWKTFNAWSRLLRTELEKVALTQAQYSILAALSYLGSVNENVSQQDVANQLSMDKMMVSDVSKTLAGKKLILRKSHPTDGRSFALSLTAEGHKLLKQAVPLVESVDEAFFGRLSRPQTLAFMGALGRLV